MTIQLLQGSSLLGSFGNPTIDPRQTQWPASSNPGAYTQFIDFSPLQPITLNPFTQYSIIASMPTNSPVAAALLFTRSSSYATASDWTMGVTTSGNPFATGEYLVMGVQATAVPEPNATALFVIGSVILMWRRPLLLGHNSRCSGRANGAVFKFLRPWRRATERRRSPTGVCSTRFLFRQYIGRRSSTLL